MSAEDQIKAMMEARDRERRAVDLMRLRIEGERDRLARALAESEKRVELGDAWAAAEAALPEGWVLQIGNWQAEPNRDPRLAKYESTAEPYRSEGGDSIIGRGDTPAAALRALAVALLEGEPDAR